MSALVSGGYRVERELATGGTATVYLAEDAKHGLARMVGHRFPLRVCRFGPYSLLMTRV